MRWSAASVSSTGDSARRSRSPAASGKARADRRDPAEQRRVLAEDRLVALRPGRDETEGPLAQLLEPLQVPARLRRQIGLVLGAAGRRAPAFDLLVDGLGLGHD